MPRSAGEGFNIRYSFENMTTAKSLQNRPKLIALADMWYMDPIHFDQDFRQKLLAGQLGYQKIAEFGPKFTPPPTKIGLRRDPCRARPVCFCLYGFRPVPDTSPRVFVQAFP